MSVMRSVALLLIGIAAISTARAATTPSDEAEKAAIRAKDPQYGVNTRLMRKVEGRWVIALNHVSSSDAPAAATPTPATSSATQPVTATSTVAPAAAPTTGGNTRAVLVTGASTGIGRTITERLAAKGYFVYAGARKQADLDALNAIENVQALRLDVTQQEQIDAAVETVTKAGRGLYGLVNNAGIATLGAVAETTMEEFDLLMQVNVYGPYRMAKSFMPLIVASKGRITNIGSISGVLAPRDLAAYSMSKHAIEAFTDSLATQLAPQGVHVNVVEPGNYDSDIGKSAAQRTGKESRFSDRSQYKKPDEVAAAVELALFEEKPKRRYMTVPNQAEAEVTIRKQIEQLVQLNEDHAYTYKRDELIGMLDAALAKARPTGSVSGTGASAPSSRSH